MRETNFYHQNLGLQEPWFLSKVKPDTQAQLADVCVNPPEGSNFCCPECHQQCAFNNQPPFRGCRRLDTMHFLTILHVLPFCIRCPEHGVKQSNLRWAEKITCFAIFSVRFAIDSLPAYQTAEGAQGILTSWDETWHILKRAEIQGKVKKAAKKILESVSMRRPSGSGITTSHCCTILNVVWSKLFPTKHTRKRRQIFCSAFKGPTRLR
jgi:transposase